VVALSLDREGQRRGLGDASAGTCDGNREGALWSSPGHGQGEIRRAGPCDGSGTEAAGNVSRDTRRCQGNLRVKAAGDRDSDNRIAALPAIQIAGSGRDGDGEGALGSCRHSERDSSRVRDAAAGASDGDGGSSGSRG